MLEYHAAYYDAGDGWFMAKVLDFPGVVTEGRPLKHARRQLSDALREMTLWYLEAGDALPVPKPNAKDRNAERQEPIRLTVKIDPGGTSLVIRIDQGRKSP